MQVELHRRSVICLYDVDTFHCYHHDSCHVPEKSRFQILLIRPPDIVCRKALINAAVMFFYQTPILLHVACSGPSNVYHRFGRTACSIVPLSILPRPPHFTGSKVSVKFGLDRQHHSSLRRRHFETKQPIGTKVWHLVQR